MIPEEYLIDLLKSNNYNLINNELIKHNYWIVIFNNDYIEAKLKEANDNYITKLYLTNWRELNSLTLKEIFKIIKFI